MDKQTIAQFQIHFTQYLSEEGKAMGDWPAFAKDPEELVKMYKEMLEMRIFDQKMTNLQRTGQLGTFPPSKGHEALAVGMGFALQKNDIFVTAYREYATQFMRGAKMRDIFALYDGDPRGNSFEAGHDFPMCVPLATQTLHAAGVAFAMKYRKEKNAVLTVFGDGASSEGDCYEALNVAGVWNLPIVFIANNNQWAISTPRSIQTGSQTIAQKAIAAGFEGEVVDGHDVIAMRAVTEKALDKARNGGGPTLIEAILYRFCPHTTADDPSRYMDQEAYNKAWKKEPLAWFKQYLEKQHLWDNQKEQAATAEAAKKIDEAFAEYRQMAPLKPTAMFDYLYEELPEPLLEQYEALMEEGE